MSKELESRINRLIGKLNTVEELSRVVAKASDRKSLIHKRERDSELDRIWDEVKGWRPGHVVVADEAWQIYSFGTREGEQTVVAKGTEFVVWWTQPKARRVWLINVNGTGVSYAAELAAHVDRLASAYQRRQLGDPVLREAWNDARKRSVGYELRDVKRCKFRRIEIHESFGADNVDRQSEQA